MIKNLSFAVCLPLIGFFCTASGLKAQCNIVDSFSENFDTYNAPESIVPGCWDRLALNGASQIISSTQPASGSSQIYQFGYGSGKVSIVIMPKISNISAGTHQFRFKAKANSGGGFLEFGYITDPTDASTFVVLQPITILNSSYDASSERTFAVPTTVPDGARLAIRNPGTSFAGHYWDDTVWEPIPNLGTKDITAPEIRVYPNPFQDVLNISDIKNIKTITVHDAVGRVIRTIGKPENQLPLSDLKEGLYFLTLYYKDGSTKSLQASKN
ncbi:T9SS type A sorting domain-containing protein [Chryseobacterium sp. JUb7]|uniref:T9SS type A sorting domain-containing protein n=1 Tax=Chryseobacterium sp. JUb7 TaxID=2940599 RepID=UPI0021674393|nr:T9SS type A sorting domain-containing protein [Chryseobacterium sp. JUb7]MCS3531907.1 hypothetical protein [Chryseobacterium sp. JUb7]